MGSLPQLSDPPTQPDLPGRTSRAARLVTGPLAAVPRARECPHPPASVSSMASGVSPAARAGRRAPGRALSSESSDCAQPVPARSPGRAAGAASSSAAFSVSATACLQSTATGQVHTPCSNRSAGPPPGAKYTVVV